MNVETRNFAQGVMALMPQTAAFAAVRAAIQSQLNQANIRQQLYFYEVDVTVANGATSAPTALAIQGDAPFVIQAGMVWATNNAALTALTPTTRITPLATIQLNDQSGPGNLQSSAVPVQNLYGVDGVPMAWPSPYTMPANSQLLHTVTSYDSAITMTLRFTYIGFKLFNAQ